MLGVPGQYESVALMLSHKMDFNCCANRDGFHRDSPNLSTRLVQYLANNSFSRGVTLQCSELPPATAVKIKVKGQ